MSLWLLAPLGCSFRSRQLPVDNSDYTDNRAGQLSGPTTGLSSPYKARLVMGSLAFPCGQVSTSAVSGKGSHFPNPRWFKFYYYSFLLLSGLAWLVSLGWLELNTIIIVALNDVTRISKSLEQRNCQVRSFTTHPTYQQQSQLPTSFLFCHPPTQPLNSCFE